jgi:hypothetical protein
MAPVVALARAGLLRVRGVRPPRRAAAKPATKVRPAKANPAARRAGAAH